RAVDQARIYPALVEFEASLAQLAADPLSAPFREAVLESARTAATGFGLATQGLDSAAEQSQFAAQNGVDRVNVLASELARANTNIARTREGSVSNAALLDQRDALLRDLSTLTGISTRFDNAGRVAVRLGDAGGPLLVEGNTAQTMAMSTQPNGSIQFAVDGNAVAPGAGQLGGYASALDRIAVLRSDLDTVANDLIARTNSAQANGATPSGAGGEPFFTGSGAADIAVALASGAGIATAPAGSPANSRDIGNLAALQSALSEGGPTAALDKIIFGLSSEINARGITRDVLETVADSAAAALASETAVDLDEEAANLVRFQQAFQASGRVIQAATDIFDTILSIR
ncbi:MAG: flagellar basal body rod C-terminal domain-containing protein, partial [Pontixanthobacter sp.]